MTTGQIVISVLFFLSIVVTIVVSITGHKQNKEKIAAKDRVTEATLQFRDKVTELGESMKKASIDTVEFNSMKRWIGGLLEQLSEHDEKMVAYGDKMDRLLKQQEAVFMPLVNVEGMIDPEELEKMIDKTMKTGILTLPREETTVIYNKVPIDADIVEAFEKRIKYYKQRPLQDYKADPKRTFLADFEQIDEWTGEYAALNKIQNFDTIVTLLSGHYYPVKEWRV